MPKYMSHTDFLSRMQVVHNTSIKVLGKYVRSSEYILVKCTTCNTKWKTRPSSLLYGCGCKTCKMKAVGIAQRKTNKQYLQEVASIHKNKIKPLGIFTTVATLTKHKCLVCNNEWVTTPNNILAGRGCKKCADLSHSSFMSRGTLWYKKELKKLHPRLKVLQEYISVHKRIRHKCKDCKTEWNALPDTILRGSGCPNCGPTIQYKVYSLYDTSVVVQGYEPIVLDHLVTKGITDIEVYSSGNVPLIKYKYKDKQRFHRPDIFIPSKNLLIEVKGLQTLGLKKRGVFKLKPKALFNSLKRKRRAALAQGFNYKLALVDNGIILRLPRTWYLLSHEGMVSYYAK